VFFRQMTFRNGTALQAGDYFSLYLGRRRLRNSKASF